MPVQLRSKVRTPYAAAGGTFTVPYLDSILERYLAGGVLELVDDPDAPEPVIEHQFDPPEPSDVASDDAMLSEQAAAEAEEQEKPAPRKAAKKATSKKAESDGEG